MLKELGHNKLPTILCPTLFK